MPGNRTKIAASRDAVPAASINRSKHTQSEARPFAGAHDGRRLRGTRRAVLGVEEVEIEAEAPERLDEIRLDVRREEAVHDLTRPKPVLENLWNA